jgi:hypothetical protein
MKATLILHRREVLRDGRFVVILNVYEVAKSKKFPEGIKAKFVLQNVADGVARLLVDNHYPYSFHMHTQLPHNHGHREILGTNDHKKALEVFLSEVERILKNEEA